MTDAKPMCMFAGCARSAVGEIAEVWLCARHGRFDTKPNTDQASSSLRMRQAEAIRALARSMNYWTADPMTKRLIRSHIRADLGVVYSAVFSALRSTKPIGRPRKPTCPRCLRPMPHDKTCDVFEANQTQATDVRGDGAA